MRRCSIQRPRRASSAGGRGTAAILRTGAEGGRGVDELARPSCTSFGFLLRALTLTFLRIRLLATVFAVADRLDLGDAIVARRGRFLGSRDRAGEERRRGEGKRDDANDPLHPQASRTAPYRDRRDIYRILEFQHVKPGKGGAFVRTKLRKIEDGSVRTRPSARARSSAGADRDAQDAVPLRLRRDGRLHGQPRLRADRDPARAAGEAMQWVLPNAEVDVLFVDETAQRRAGRRARSR